MMIIPNIRFYTTEIIQNIQFNENFLYGQLQGVQTIYFCASLRLLNNTMKFSECFTPMNLEKDKFYGDGYRLYHLKCNCKCSIRNNSFFYSYRCHCQL